MGPDTSSGELARLALDETRANEWGYTLYAKDRDSAGCPLLGCERPHSIQLARIRQSLCTEEGFDLTHCNNNRIPSDIVFELKPNCKPSVANRKYVKCLFYGLFLMMFMLWYYLQNTFEAVQKEPV